MNNDNQKEYSNREIDRFFSEIQQSLDRIEIQTTKTNGRATVLEAKVEKLQEEKRSNRRIIIILWALAVVIIIPLLVYINNLQIQLSNTVQAQQHK